MADAAAVLYRADSITHKITSNFGYRKTVSLHHNPPRSVLIVCLKRMRNDNSLQGDNIPTIEYSLIKKKHTYV